MIASYYETYTDINIWIIRSIGSRNEYSTLCQNFGDYVRESGCTCDTSAGHAGAHDIECTCIPRYNADVMRTCNRMRIRVLRIPY